MIKEKITFSRLSELLQKKQIQAIDIYLSKKENGTGIFISDPVYQIIEGTNNLILSIKNNIDLEINKLDEVDITQEKEFIIINNENFEISFYIGSIKI